MNFYLFIKVKKGGCISACMGTQSQTYLQNCLIDIYQTW